MHGQGEENTTQLPNTAVITTLQLPRESLILPYGIGNVPRARTNWQRGKRRWPSQQVLTRPYRFSHGTVHCC